MIQPTIILTLIVSTTFAACRQPKYKSNFEKKNIAFATKNNKVINDEFCDTTKITDFRNNLRPENTELTNIEKDYQDKQAKDFISQSCKRDTLFCVGIKLRISKTYKYDDEWKLLLTGYVLDQGTGMEENSASFFVLTILRNDAPWFTDFLEDLIGEIQVDLNGFEDKNKQITVWGHAYPYFQSDYGKFRLIIKNGMTFYEYQCHSQH
jgi:hypothetical protein